MKWIAKFFYGIMVLIIAIITFLVFAVISGLAWFDDLIRDRKPPTDEEKQRRDYYGYF